MCPAKRSTFILTSTEVPGKGTLLQNGEKHKVTVHGAPRGQKAYIRWGVALFPKGIVNDTAITTPVHAQDKVFVSYFSFFICNIFILFNFILFRLRTATYLTLYYLDYALPHI
jgi:hypothetical protein